MLKLEQFKEAKERLNGVIKETKLIYSPTFRKNAKTKFILNRKTYKLPEHLRLEVLITELHY